MTVCVDALDLVCYWSNAEYVAFSVYVGALILLSACVQIVWSFFRKS